MPEQIDQTALEPVISPSEVRQRLPELMEITDLTAATAEQLELAIVAEELANERQILTISERIRSAVASKMRSKYESQAERDRIVNRVSVLVKLILSVSVSIATIIPLLNLSAIVDVLASDVFLTGIILMIICVAIYIAITITDYRLTRPLTRWLLEYPKSLDSDLRPLTAEQQVKLKCLSTYAKIQVLIDKLGEAGRELWQAQNSEQYSAAGYQISSGTLAYNQEQYEASSRELSTAFDAINLALSKMAASDEDQADAQAQMQELARARIGI